MACSDLSSFSFSAHSVLMVRRCTINRPLRLLVAVAATQEPCRRPETRMDTGFSGIPTSQPQGVTVSATRRAYRRLWTKPRAHLELACRFLGTPTLGENMGTLSTPDAGPDCSACLLHSLGLAITRRLSICAQPQATYPGLAFGMVVGCEYVPSSIGIRGLVPGCRRARGGRLQCNQQDAPGY